MSDVIVSKYCKTGVGWLWDNHLCKWVRRKSGIATLKCGSCLRGNVVKRIGFKCAVCGAKVSAFTGTPQVEGNRATRTTAQPRAGRHEEAT